MIEDKKEWKALETDVKRRLGRAEQERNRFASAYNDFYELAAPHRKRVGSKSSVPRNPDEQAEIFDTTLQDTADDFQADMLDLFTPRYRDWTRFEPSSKLRDGERRQIEGEIGAFQKDLFDTIRQSNFYEAMQEAWCDIGVGCGAISVPNAAAGDDISCSIVQAADLLIEQGPNGIDGRWRQLDVCPDHLEELFPTVDWTAYRRKHGYQRSTSNVAVNVKTIKLAEGFHRDWADRSDVWWFWTVFAGGEMVHAERVRGEGAPTIIPVRWRVAAPSPWGVGPYPKAIPPGRTLNELHYLMLKWLGKQVDPPFAYDQDTVFNPAGGIDAGRAYPRMPGTQIQFLLTDQDIRGALFEQEDLRMSIRRALYQDKPFQRGDTPPTATQWLDEKSFNNRRIELPRERINRELVMGVLQRILWIKRDQGSLAEIKLNGELISVVPVSPLSKASDAEEVNVSSQVLSIARGYFPATAEQAIDARATIEAIQKKLDDKLIKLRSQDEYQALALAQVAGGGGGGGSAPVSPV